MSDRERHLRVAYPLCLSDPVRGNGRNATVAFRLFALCPVNWCYIILPIFSSVMLPAFSALEAPVPPVAVRSVTISDAFTKAEIDREIIRDIDDNATKKKHWIRFTSMLAMKSSIRSKKTLGTHG